VDHSRHARVVHRAGDEPADHTTLRPGRYHVRRSDPGKAWAIAKTAGELSTKLFAFRKTLKSGEEKRQIDEILDAFSDLKHSASKLEDENRDLKDRLRFRSDDYVFRNPFRYHKDRPNEPLCVKCFAKSIEAPMSELREDGSSSFRRCLVCERIETIGESRSEPLPMRTDLF
jgi:hypothetical protein